MIELERVPLPLLDAERLKVWFTRDEAHIFRRCINSQMHEYYTQAINTQLSAKTKDDQDKFVKQSQFHIDQARDIQTFIRVFEMFSDPNYGFFTLKIK